MSAAGIYEASHYSWSIPLAGRGVGPAAFSSGSRFAGGFCRMGSLQTVSFGKLGEELARAELVRQGYAIVATRYRTRIGEIDIVARDRDALVFVEVKARVDTRHGTPAEAVTLWKQARIVAMAQTYLASHARHEGPIRFDVVAVLMSPGQPAKVEVIRRAFTSDGQTCRRGRR